MPSEPRILEVTKRKEGSGKVNEYVLSELSSFLRQDGLLLISYSTWAALYKCVLIKIRAYFTRAKGIKPMREQKASAISLMPVRVEVVRI